MNMGYLAPGYIPPKPVEKPDPVVVLVKKRPRTPRSLGKFQAVRSAMRKALAHRRVCYVDLTFTHTAQVDLHRVLAINGQCGIFLHTQARILNEVLKGSSWNLLPERKVRVMLLEHCDLGGFVRVMSEACLEKVEVVQCR